MATLYSVNFWEDWLNPNTYISHSQLREETIIGEIKFGAEKLTSVDYFKSEARTAKLSFLNYTWFNDNVLNFRNGIHPMGSILGTGTIDYSKYKVKIFVNDALKFTGLIKLSSIKYDKKTDTVEITCYDMLALIKEGLKLTYDHEDYLTKPINLKSTFDNILDNILENVDSSLNNTSQWYSRIWDNVITANYSAEPVFPPTIYDENEEDPYMTGITWFGYTGQTPPEPVNKCFRIDADAMIRLYAYQLQYYNYAQGAQGVRIKKVIIQIDGVVANVLLDEITDYGPGFDLTSVLQIPIVINNSLTLTFPAESYYTIGSVDQFYNFNGINGTYNCSPTCTIVFTGSAPFISVYLGSASVSYDSLLKAILLINNISLSCGPDGIIIGRNKNQYEESLSTVDIYDSDITKYQLSALGWQLLEPEESLGLFNENNMRQLVRRLNVYYGTIFKGRLLSLECIKCNIDQLHLAQKINVNDQDYMISELTETDTLYKLKAWEI